MLSLAVESNLGSGHSHPGAASSLREGMAETLTLTRLGIKGKLKQTLESTNPCESMIECVRRSSRNVKHLQSGDMALRWTAAGMLEAERQFRRIIGYKDLANLDMSLPANQAKLEAADALGKLADEAGMTLVEMALAFVIRHPGVTAAIIGPRTMEHLEGQLTAADADLPGDVLDRIDEIVPPGVNISPGDAGWSNPALEPEARRR